jgi:hypothetical protein
MACACARQLTITVAKELFLRATTNRLLVVTTVAAGVGILVSWYQQRGGAEVAADPSAIPAQIATSASSPPSGMMQRTDLSSATIARQATLANDLRMHLGNRADDNTVPLAAEQYAATEHSVQELYALEQRVELALDPTATIEADCRRSACRVRIYSEEGHLISVMGDYPLGCMANFSTADLEQRDPGHRYADVYMLFNAESHGPEAFEKNRDLTCPKYRSEWLQYIQKPFTP